MIDLGDGLLDDVIRAVLQFSKNQRVGEGGGEALEVEDGAVLWRFLRLQGL